MLAAAALWVRATSKGKLLFVQERVGLGGHRFRCFKLRTMHEGCATGSHQKHLETLLKGDKPLQKLDGHDPRLIPGARLLRALGIDELPQLFNVLRGEMSVIGPRPCIPYEAEQFGEWHRERFAVQPGMTGLWQVKGKNSTTFTQMISLDIEYSRTRSLGLDLWILCATPRALFKQLAQVIQRRASGGRSPLSPAPSVPMPTAGESGVVG